MVAVHTASTHLTREQLAPRHHRHRPSMCVSLDSTVHEQAWKRDPEDVSSNITSRRLMQAVSQHKQKKSGKTLQHMRTVTGEGEGVQTVCTHNAQSVISLFGILMVDVTEGQSAAHTHT
jgi:hypothetical protein